MSVRHPHSAKPFSLCIYEATYFMAMPLFSQNSRSFVNINSPPLSTLSAFIKHPDLVSTWSSHIWNASTKLSFPRRYNIQVFWVRSHMSIAVYVLPDREGGSCSPQRSAYTSSSLFIVGVMLLFLLTILVNLLFTYRVHSLSKILLSLVSALNWQATELSSFEIGCKIGCVGPSSDWESSPEFFISESFESTNTSARLYSSTRPRLTPSTSLKTLTTCVLLVWASRWYQRRMRLFWLMRWVNRPRLITAIALLMTDMTCRSITTSRVNRLRSLLV